jgi:hypothetical protein
VDAVQTSAWTTGWRFATWRRAAAWGVVVAWGLLSLVRLSVFAPPSAEPPGQAYTEFYARARNLLPAAVHYLYLDASAYAGDPAVGIRLRYELAPRVFGGRSVDMGLDATEAYMKASGRGYLVIPTLRGYPSPHWLTQEHDWYMRVRLSTGFVLVVTEPIANPATAR